MGTQAVTPQPADPFAGLGAVYEDAKPKAPAAPQDPWAALGAQLEPPSAATPKPAGMPYPAGTPDAAKPFSDADAARMTRPVSPVPAPNAPPAPGIVDSHTQTLMDTLRLAKANAQIHQALAAPPAPPVAPAAAAAASPLRPEVAAVGDRFPAYKPYLNDVVIHPGKSLAGDDRQSEFYPPWESQNPNPGKLTVQPLRPDLASGPGLTDTVSGELLHYIGGINPETGKPVDPDYQQIKQAVAAARTPTQQAVDQREYAAAVAHGEKRPFDQWLNQSRLDEYIMGYITPDQADEWRKGGWYSDPKMHQAVEKARQYLTGTQPTAAMEGAAPAPQKDLFGRAWDWARGLPTGLGGSQTTSTFGGLLDRAGGTLSQWGQNASAAANEPMLPHVANLLDQLDQKYGPPKQTPEQHKAYLVSQGVPEAEAERFKNMGSADPLRAAIDAYKGADPTKLAAIKDRSASVANVLRGAGAGGRQLADGLTTPENAALLYAIGEESVPRAAKMLADMGFAWQQAKDAVRSLQAGYAAYKKGDIVTASEEWTIFPVDALFAFLTGHHAVDEGANAVGETAHKIASGLHAPLDVRAEGGRGEAGGRAEREEDPFAALGAQIETPAPAPPPPIAKNSESVPRATEEHPAMGAEAARKKAMITRQDEADLRSKGYTQQQIDQMRPEEAGAILQPSAEEHPPIGATEPETGRPVLQQSPRPEVNQAAATAEHPAVKDQIEALVKPIEGAEVAGARAEKDEDRLGEKMGAEGQSPRTVRDYSGFRIAVDSPAARDAVVANLRKNFEVPNESDEFDKGAEETGFHGHTLQVREPGSPVSHEVQVLPREVADAANDRHGLYEKAREGDQEAAAQLKAANEADWQKFAARNQAEGKPGGGAAPAEGSQQQQPTEPNPAAIPVQPILPADSEAAQEAARPERRQNLERRQRIAEMTPEQMRRELLTSEKTGLPNRRAFDEVQRSAPAKAVAMSDADGLKAVNDRLGYAAGDALLKAKAEALREAGIDAYHEKGDEFLYRGGSPEELRQKLEQARAALRDRMIEAQMADGTVRRFKGADFSYGTGNDLAGAEAALKEHKAGREASGERARGELRGITETGSKTGEERAPGAGGGAGEAVAAGIPEQPARSLFGEEAPRTARASELKPNEVGRVPVADLKADPKRFQYKMNTDAAGTTDLLKGRKWDPALAQTISVWRDPADGNVYVVNGHHRFELATSAGVRDMNVLMLDAPDAETARSIGAKQNIADGRGTAIDAAKFFRDSGFTTPEDLRRANLSMKDAMASDGIALSRLDDRLFDDVVSGKLRQNRAVAIGKATDKPEEQEAILKIIEKAESRGRKVSDETVDELARMAKGAGAHTETQQTLFGAQEMTRNLALEKAEVSSYIRDQIGKEKRLFGSVADEGKAARLAQGENTINAAKNKVIAERAAQAQEMYDRLSTRAGDVDDILSRAAQELAQGKENPNAVKQRSYEAVRAALSQTLREPARGELEGVREGARGAEKAPEHAAAAQRSQGLKAPTPPERGPKPEKWEKGERFLVRDPATGKWRSGEVTYYNDGVNGAKPGGRSRIGDAKLDEIPPNAVRVKTIGGRIAPITGTPEEADVISRVEADEPGYVARYIENPENSKTGVLEIATDAAKDLFPEFKADPTNNDRTVAAAAGRINKAVLKTALSEPVDPKRPEVQIATASPGSGKTATNKFGPNEAGIGIKVESILDDAKDSRKLLNQIIDSGRKPVVNWIYVDDIGTTVERMLRRAIGHDGGKGIGRTVQLNYMIDAYHSLPRVLEEMKREFGDRVTWVAVDNSGPKGSARAVNFDDTIAKAQESSYNEIRERAYEKVNELRDEGLFESERGQAALRAAETTDQPNAQNPGSGGSGTRPEDGRGPEQVLERASERGSPVLSHPSDKDLSPGAPVSTEGRMPSPVAKIAGQEAGGSVSPEEFAEALKGARARSLRDNAATQKAQVIDTPRGGSYLSKAVAMDPDAMGVWYRAGLGDKTAWRGLSMPKAAANRVELLLRSLAGSARAEGGGAEAAAGYDRMVDAMRKARSDDGSVTLLRGDYRPDTVLEEAWHNWQRSKQIEGSEPIRAIAQRPEVKEAAARLREMGYGMKPGIEGRTELAMEMMAKALSGDPDLKITPEQRYDLAHAFLSHAVREFGPEVLKEIPGVTPEAEAAVADARRVYAEQDEAGGGRPARGQGEGNGSGAARLSRVEAGARSGGREGQPAAGGDERGAPGAGEEEDQLRFARARSVRPEDSLSLPGMDEADREREEARGAQQAADLTEAMRAPKGDISKAAGEMERNSPLFFGSPDGPQGTLFQRTATEENPVARSVQDLVEALAKEPRSDDRTALEKVADWTARTYDESTGRSGRTLREVPTKFESAWAKTKLITASLVDGWRNPLKATDWKRSVGQMDLARAETSLKLRALGKQIKDAVPDRAARIGMTHWIEAGGDPRKLDEWALMASERWKIRRGDPNISPRLKNHYADAVEHYKAATALTPEQKALATRIKQHFDDMLQVAKANGMLEYGARNYVRHLYEAADAADLVKLLDTNELDPNPGFLEKRIFRTYFEAENHGMIPRNKDVGYLVTAYDKSFNQALASRGMLRSLLDGKGADGRPLAAIRLRGKWLSVGDDQKPLVLQQRERPKSLAGYKYMDLAPTRNFLFEPTREDLDGYEYDPKLFEEDPQRLAFKGDLVFHPEIAGRVEDMLTPGWFDRNETAPQKIGHAVLKGSALAKEVMTMAAPFHLVQLGEHSVEHWVNPFNLPEIDLSGKGEASRKQRLLASNGLGLMDFDAEGLFSARALKGLSEGIPGVNVAMSAIESLSRWQFEDVIPRMKMKMAMTAFDRNWKSYGAKIESQELSKLRGMKGADADEMAHESAERMVAELTAKQANAAFGNLNTAFDSIHRSKTFKQLLRLTMFAPDFLESRIRYTGQAMTRYGGEQRMALLRGALGMWVIARAANALLNNGDTKNDLEHAFTVVAGSRNFSLRSQEGDILHLIDDPRGFIYNRVNPLTTRPTIEYLSGRDQFGRQKTGLHVLRDTAKATLPFGVQKVIQTSGEGWVNSLLSSAGVIASNYRSPAEEMTHKLYLRSIPDLPDDPEREAESRSRYQLEEAVREGKKKPGDVIELAKEGKLTLRQAWSIVDRAGHSRLYNEFASGGVSIVPKHAGDPSALDIYAEATPAERMELRPALITKGENQIPDVRREAPASSAEVRALEKEWKEQAKLDPDFEAPTKVPDTQFDVLAARWRALLASTPHEKGVPPAPGAVPGSRPTLAQK